jgi:hypothetical protein
VILLVAIKKVLISEKLTRPAVSEVMLASEQLELPGTNADDTFDHTINLSFTSVRHIDGAKETRKLTPSGL